MKLETLWESAKFWLAPPRAETFALSAELRRYAERIDERDSCGAEVHPSADLLDLRQVGLAVGLHLCHIAAHWHEANAGACPDLFDANQTSQRHEVGDLLLTLYAIGENGTQGPHCSPRPAQDSPRGAGAMALASGWL